MWNESTVAGAMRAALGKYLPPDATLLRDRRDALFVTRCRIEDAEDFHITRRGDLWAITPADRWILELEHRATAGDHFSESLRRFAGMPPCEEARRLFIRGVKLLDGGATDADSSLFDRAARNLAALALRRGEAGGTYAAAILNHELQNLRRKSV